MPILSALILGALIIALEIKKRYKVALAIFALFACFVLFLAMDNWGSNDYYYYQSPDLKSTIVIHESGWLWAGSINCYVKDNDFFVKRLNGRVETDGGYVGQFSFKWIDNEHFSLEGICIGINDLLPNGASATNIMVRK
jgi:hypothetical protein